MEDQFWTAFMDLQRGWDTNYFNKKPGIKEFLYQNQSHCDKDKMLGTSIINV